MMWIPVLFFSKSTCITLSSLFVLPPLILLTAANVWPLRWNLVSHRLPDQYAAFKFWVSLYFLPSRWSFISIVILNFVSCLYAMLKCTVVQEKKLDIFDIIAQHFTTGSSRKWMPSLLLSTTVLELFFSNEKTCNWKNLQNNNKYDPTKA